MHSVHYFIRGEGLAQRADDALIPFRVIAVTCGLDGRVEAINALPLFVFVVAILADFKD